jgi:hypothetical protein
MTELERDDLLADSAQVRDEVIEGANTATRVGTLFTNIVNFAYSAWLGITDETTHLLTPKEIREGADPETKLITVLDLPENDGDQLAIVDDKATIIQLNKPKTGTVISFSTPAKYGSWLNPLSSMTLSFANARENVVTVFIEAVSIPADIAESQDYILPWTGDAFNTTVGTINKLTLTYTIEDSPQNRLIEVHNKAVEIGSIIADPSLIGFWKFEETEANWDNIFDSSGYGNDGEAVLPGVNTRFAGKVGNAVQFAVPDDIRFYVPKTAGFDFSGNELTVMSWVSFPESALSLGCGIMEDPVNTDGLGTLGGFQLWKESDGRFRFNLGQGGTSSRVRSTTFYTTADVWVHVCAVWTGTQSLMYINGVLQNTTNYTSSYVEGNFDLTVGGISGQTIRGGRLDEARLFNKVLTLSEIQDIYNEEV